jgi:hypothetical protein
MEEYYKKSLSDNGHIIFEPIGIDDRCNRVCKCGHRRCNHTTEGDSSSCDRCNCMFYEERK